MITPLDIEKKDFAIEKRGYSQEEVDEFLDEIIIDLQQILKENKELKNELDRTKTKIDNDVNSGSTVYETLESAKSLMNDIAASAERRAEILIENAELEAEAIKKQALDEVRSYTEEGARLKGMIDRMKKSYREMLLTEAKRVDNDAEDLISQIESELSKDKVEDYNEKQTIVCDKISSDENNDEDLKETIVMERLD